MWPNNLSPEDGRARKGSEGHTESVVASQKILSIKLFENFIQHILAIFTFNLPLPGPPPYPQLCVFYFV